MCFSSRLKVSGSLTSLKMTLMKYRKVYVIYDRNVAPFAAKIVGGKVSDEGAQKGLVVSDSKPSLGIVADESGKDINAVVGICRWLMANNAGRDSLLLAVGGGFTSDIAGFAASIYKRGIRYANVPTTLLSMVDASIGGKTGVNLDFQKNMLGTFHRPEFTYICPPVLETLPSREFNSGVAELLKTFIIDNRHNWYDRAMDIVRAPFDAQAIEPAIKAAARIKMKIVRKDPCEKGARKVLNLGHTYAHAVEWWQRKNGVDNPLTHGEAVAVGIVQAARKSVSEGLCDSFLPDKLANDFEKCGLPVTLPCPSEELEKVILNDKKSDGEKISFVFPRAIGKVVVRKI